ncbi:MAG: trypsin-like peptidase domain-containing protein [Nitrospinae bacterium]|nr:trypsin-like peptidase domain-containing protein [Nitrospinota bacterium]
MKSSVLLAAIAAPLLAFLTPVNSYAANRRTVIVEAVEKTSPAVVNINTSKREQVNPFRRSPLGAFGGALGPMTVERESLGSGVIIKQDGYILTNNHVIDGATEIRVTLADEREFAAEVVGADPASDLAVIKVSSATPLPVAKMGRSDDIMIGETIIAIGNPFGLTHSATTGIISATGRSVQVEEDRMLHDFIQLDAPINPGNSGGALVNINGELIGITTAVHKGGEGIGFAIPIDKAKRIVADLISFGAVSRAWFGFFARDLSSELRYRLGWKGKGGAIVTKVFGVGPARKAGLAAGDIVTAINGKKVSDRKDLYSRLAAMPEGSAAIFNVFRSPAQIEISIKGTRITPAVADQIGYEWIGVSVAPADKNNMARFGLPAQKGLVISKIDPASELAKTGVREGDVIRKINRTTADSQEGFRNAVMESQGYGGAILYVQRGQYVYQISIGD